MLVPGVLAIIAASLSLLAFRKSTRLSPSGNRFRLALQDRYPTGVIPRGEAIRLYTMKLEPLAWSAVGALLAILAPLFAAWLILALPDHIASNRIILLAGVLVVGLLALIYTVLEVLSWWYAAACKSWRFLIKLKKAERRGKGMETVKIRY